MARQSRAEDEWAGALRIGSHLRGYIIENVLGQGGYGIVYRCRHAELGTIVAIKEYLPNEHAVRVGGRVRVRNHVIRPHFEDGLRRFKEEALRLVEFNDHPNIVSCQDFFRLNGTAYSVMDYEVGIPLSKLLHVREARHRPFVEKDLLAIVIPLLDGLKRLHDRGVIHRDIKPSNILIRFADGQPVLIDFGAAKHSVALHTKSYAPFTPGYAALEQLADGALGPWTDIYGIGAIMWRMVAGGDPLQPVRVERRASAILQGKDDPMPSARQARNDRHSEDHLFRTVVLEAIDKCLSVNPGDRVQNSEDLIRLLQLEEGTARSCMSSARSVMLGTQLHFEAWSGESADITELVASGADMAARDPDGRTALHWAAEAGNIETLKQLLSSGSYVDSSCRQGETALHIASRYGHANCVEALISSGAELEVGDIDGQSPLHLAAANGRLECVKALISRGADADWEGEKGLTALHIALIYGKIECVQPLVDEMVKSESFVEPIERGYDRGWITVDPFVIREIDEALFKAYVNALSTLKGAREWLLTAVHSIGYIDMLVSMGLELESDDGWADRALLEAARYGNPKYVSALLEAGVHDDVTDEQGQSALLLAARHGHSECIDAFGDAGFDVPSEQGPDAILLAAKHGHPYCVEALLGAGVDISGEHGRSALLLAAKHGHWDCVGVLCNSGVEISGEHGRSALLLAAKHGAWQSFEKLCNAGAQIESRNSAKRTALDCAFYLARECVSHQVDLPRLIDWLLYRIGIFPDLDALHKYGRSALLLAAKHGRWDCVGRLCNAGVDIDVKDANGRTALHIAAIEGHLHLFEQLVRSGADVGVTDIKGRSALDYALRITGDEWTEALGSSGGRHSHGRQETPHSSQ